MMGSASQIAVDAVFEEFGLDALYLSEGGEPVPATVIPRRGDGLLDFGETKVSLDSEFFEVRRSELAEPLRNACLEVDGALYLIQSDPRIEDVNGLVWILDTRKA